jgi:hypothetical protein
LMVLLHRQCQQENSKASCWTWWPWHGVLRARIRP